MNGATEYSMSPELNNEFLSGTVVTYTCIEGFELFGNEMRTCQGNRSWTGNPPTCQGGRYYCQSLVVKLFVDCNLFINAIIV